VGLAKLAAHTANKTGVRSTQANQSQDVIDSSFIWDCLCWWTDQTIWTNGSVDFWM